MSIPPAKLQQADAHARAGRLDQAKAVLLPLVQRNPGHPVASAALAAVLRRQGQHQQAVYHAQRAATAAGTDPAGPGAVVDLAWLFYDTGGVDEAVTLLKSAALAAPGNPAAFGTLRVMLYSAHRIGEMLAVCRDAAAARPDRPDLVGAHATALMLVGRADEAAAMVRAALRSHPTDMGLAATLCGCLNYTDADPADVLTAHTHHGRLLAARAGAPVARPPVNPDSQRPLRVGLVSPDLRAHPVAVFLGAFLAQVDRASVEVVGYYTGAAPDAASDRLRGLMAGWRHLHAVPDRDLATAIAADRIDILIDLAGHFAGNSLGAMALRPAPVQATYLGYPNTTGLAAIDYRVVDSRTDPPGAEARAVEKLLRLDPCFLCYALPPDAPAPAPPPSAASGHITFGSFNTLHKLSDRAVLTWSRLLQTVPGSRLLLKNSALTDPTVRTMVAERFVAAGVDAGRLDLVARIDTISGHLGAYARMDIALDTFPYNGTTTTCEALAMGVPVVTLTGSMHAGRVGVSLVSAAGMPGWIAGTEDEYVRIAAALAADVPGLAALRGSLRPRLLASPLCDARAFAGRFVEALRGIWRAAGPGSAA